MKDLDCNEEIILNKSGSNITLDLNGFKIKYSSNNNKSLFNVSNSAEFTITDSHPGEDNIAGSQPLQDQDHNLIADNCGKTAKMLYEKDVPTELTYYVTKSSVDTKDSTRTNETTYEHKVTIKGAIVACSSSKVNLIKLNGGTFNLQGGVLTQKNNCNVDGLIYAQNGSTVDMSGGYVCGASMGRDGAGAGIHVEGEGSTLVISDGVIAGNYAPSGGGVYAMNSTVNMVGGIISGNGTNNNQNGYGAGICAEKSSVTITKGYITNNNYQFYTNWEGSTKHLGNGCHGGGGIAAFNGGNLTIAGGYITGNYSAEAGGGVYAGAWNRALSGFTFSGGIIASNVAQSSEGGGIRIAAPTVGEFNVSGKKAYITNNTTNTAYDWGGGGVFVQGGNSDQNIDSASLKIYNALITNNSAQGYGGGFAACPTGKTAITDTNGIAIFGNTDADGNKLSGDSNEKKEDRLTDDGGVITPDFKKYGHEDLFLVHKKNNGDYIAAVTGQMLGGGAANWKGTIDDDTGTQTFIGKYEGAQAKYRIGLAANPTEPDKDEAIKAATLFITGNTSNVHGGGIMTNGDVVAGSTTEVKVYPKMKLNGTKALKGRELKNGEFTFQLLKQNEIKDESGRVTGYTVPSFDANGKLHPNGCSVVDTAVNAKNGSFSFNLSEVYADAGLVYYLVEDPGTDKDVDYDKTIYRIDPQVVKDDKKSHSVLGIEYTYYTVESVALTKIAADGSKTDIQVKPENEDGIACVALTNGATFTNYIPSGVWTPKATKVVEGGEMKAFTLQLAEDSEFKNIIGTAVTSGSEKTQTLPFKDTKDNTVELKYSLSDIRNNSDDPGGSTGGPFKTFAYYVREETDGSQFSHYTYDQSVYKFTVVPTYDTEKGEIKCAVTYKKGTVNSNGEWTADANTAEETFTDASTPTFTNTYSTSLPLSGMSGVTLTYLAGAAVLCAAAAWMHIRRKANAKGGGRRE